MGRKMKNAPVYFVIAQVRFNPVLSLPNYVAGIQESFRKAGFPDFKRLATLTFNLTVAQGADGPASPPSAQPVERYIFIHRDGRSGFWLTQAALSFQTTNYDTFETFLRDFSMGLEIVHKAVGLDYSERVGIRYLDAAVPGGGEKLGDYLAPEALGLRARLPDRTVGHSFTETVFVYPEIGNVLARVIAQAGPLGFPPDLQPDGLKVLERFENLSGPHAIIDTDGYFEGREVFDQKQIGERLDKLHQEIHHCFHAMITDHARAIWG